MQDQHIRELSKDLLLVKVDRLFAGFALIVLDCLTLKKLFQTLLHIGIVFDIQCLSIERFLLPCDMVAASAGLLGD